MTEFISRAYGGKEWEVIIKTDCKEHYKYAVLFARKLIDHGKTHTMAQRGSSTSSASGPSRPNHQRREQEKPEA